jgi:CRP-like cAMP-binding protein
MKTCLEDAEEERGMSTFEVFEGLSKRETNRIFDMGVLRVVEEGKLLFRKGEIGHEMYVILSGRIDIVEDYDMGETTGMTTLAELRAGELFGEMAMFEQSHTRSAHALAKEASQVLVLSEEILDKLLKTKIPRKFLANIITVLCHRLRATNNMYMRSKYGDRFAPEPE